MQIRPSEKSGACGVEVGVPVLVAGVQIARDVRWSSRSPSYSV